jgi:hypothetical protein
MIGMERGVWRLGFSLVLIWAWGVVVVVVDGVMPEEVSIIMVVVEVDNEVNRFTLVDLEEEEVAFRVECLVDPALPEEEETLHTLISTRYFVK